MKVLVGAIDNGSVDWRVDPPVTPPVTPPAAAAAASAFAANLAVSAFAANLAAAASAANLAASASAANLASAAISSFVFKVGGTIPIGAAAAIRFPSASLIMPSNPNLVITSYTSPFGLSNNLLNINLPLSIPANKVAS